MGPNPDVGGLYHAHGYNSGGVMMSGGSGLMLAQWIINGQPELDMFDYDIRSDSTLPPPSPIPVYIITNFCHGYHTLLIVLGVKTNKKIQTITFFVIGMQQSKNMYISVIQ